MRVPITFASAVLALSACTSTPPAPGLENSTWRLTGFNGPAGSGSAMQASDPERYTLSFGKDGRLSAKLDCNRGSGSYQAVPADMRGGSLRIGPLATTRAMCAPDPLGARLANDLESLGSYRLQDGSLSTSLPADAGTYTWERISP